MRNSLQSLLTACQGEAIGELRNELRNLERGFQKARFPVDGQQLDLFTETRKVASKVYNEKLNPEDGADLLRGMLQKCVGSEELKVEEHYFKQMLQAVGGPDLPPPEFFCPIALEIMRDPVVLVETAVTYDRSSLDTWLYTYGNDTCPVSRKQLVDPKYVENKVAKSLIDDWLRTHDYKKAGDSRTPTNTDSVWSEFDRNTSVPYFPLTNASDLPGIRIPRADSCGLSEYDRAFSQGAVDFTAPGPSERPVLELMKHDEENSDFQVASELSSTEAWTPKSFLAPPASTTLNGRHPLPMTQHDYPGRDVIDDMPMHIGFSLSEGNRPRSLKTPPQTVVEDMQHAARDGHLSELKKLAEEGWRLDYPDESGRNCLHLSATNGQSAVVRFLLLDGVDINCQTKADCSTPLYMAAGAGHFDVVRIFLLQGANIMITNKAGWTPLHVAADRGHSEIVRILLEHASNIGLRMYMAMTTRAGWSPLHHATRSGHHETVLLLVDSPCLKDKTCNVGFTALHVAVDNGHLLIVDALLDAGVNINIQSKDGWSALHVAQDKNDIQVGRILLRRGANPDLTGKGGVTALHRAAHLNHLEFARMLVEEGHADVKKRTTPPGSRGRKAIQIACDHRHDELYSLLFKHAFKRMLSFRK
ncbi:hypothetical protein BSKO_14140 [Bryopsis sp. KO-2023]|nr:hypothetical protein BSKO_14140 [Bryopsis sp. KO-2023]